MDINTLDAVIAQDEEAVTVTIYQKNGDPYVGADGAPSTITVQGSESKAYRKALDAFTRRSTRARSKPEPEDIMRDSIALAASAVTGWSGWECDGQPWPASAENVKALLRAPHILVQVNRAIAEHAANFLEHSKTSAPSSATK